MFFGMRKKRDKKECKGLDGRVCFVGCNGEHMEG